MSSEGMRAPLRLLSIVGTRPEAIKIAPVALEAARRPHLVHHIFATRQHGALFDEALAAFGVRAGLWLGPPFIDPDPRVTTGRLHDALLPAIRAFRPDCVLVQGDTSSAYAGALAAAGANVPIAHIEAGLRSGDLARPWPEEGHRIAIDRLSTLLFAPTEEAAANLRSEPLVTGSIHVTGNTGIDALLIERDRSGFSVPSAEGPSLILLTCHRREAIGAGLDGICDAALRLADRGDVRILCPVHPNHAVHRQLHARLEGHPAITLLGALSYRALVATMAAARLILTDSGGIQEEAPALGIPTLVLRDVTERPEGVASGNLALVGTDPERIVVAATRLLVDPAAHAAMARPQSPFGDGRAAARILDHIERYFSHRVKGEHSLPLGAVWRRDAALQGV